MGNITVTDLQRGAETYSKNIAKIPAAKIAEVAKIIGCNVANLTQTHKYLTLERKGGLLTPYKLGEEIVGRDAVGKVKEMPLMMYRSYISTQDDITRYDFDDKKSVLVNGGQPVDMQSGKHPLEALILFGIVNTMSEDIIDNMFFGAHDDTAKTPNAAFDGFYTIIAALMEADAIAAGEKNFAESGALATPTGGDDTAAYDGLVEWLRQASPKLLYGAPKLRLSSSALLNVSRAYANKVKYFKAPTIEETIEAIRQEVMSPR
ncbi:MAG: hypothetical protein ACRCZB_08000, partial [Bacteroidales bacterium]